jgi:hypothetical protein
MPIGQDEWERATWRVAPHLDLPELSPSAVQCAVLDADPLPRYREQIGRLGASEQARSARELRREAAWNSVFGEVTGDDLFLLTDFIQQELPAGSAPEGGAMVSVTRPFVVVSGDSAEGRKWLVTKTIHVGGKLLAWSVPFEAKRGHLSSITLRLANAIELEEEPAERQ